MFGHKFWFKRKILFETTDIHPQKKDYVDPSRSTQVLVSYPEKF